MIGTIVPTSAKITFDPPLVSINCIVMPKRTDLDLDDQTPISVGSSTVNQLFNEANISELEFLDDLQKHLSTMLPEMSPCLKTIKDPDIETKWEIMSVSFNFTPTQQVPGNPPARTMAMEYQVIAPMPKLDLDEDLIFVRGSDGKATGRVISFFLQSIPLSEIESYFQKGASNFLSLVKEFCVTVAENYFPKRDEQHPLNG